MTPEERAYREEVARQIAAQLRLKRNTFAEIERLLTISEDTILEILAGAPTDYQSWYLPQLQQSIQEALQAFQSQGPAILDQGMDDGVLMGAAMVDGPLAAAGIDLVGLGAPAVNPQQLVAMRSFALERIRDVTVEIANRIGDQLAQVMTGVQTVDEAVTEIQAILDAGRRRARTIVYDQIGKAYSVASHDRLKQAGQVVPGLKKQWRRSGKVHPRMPHVRADGQIRAIDEPFDVNGVKLMHPRDPAGPLGETINCGCVELPYKDSWTMSTPGNRPITPEEAIRDPGLFQQYLAAR